MSQPPEQLITYNTQTTTATTSQPPQQLITYNTRTRTSIKMASQPYYAHSNAQSHTKSEEYREHSFLKSLPDEHATVRQVVIWIDSGDKSRYIGSDPNWLNYFNFDGYAINKLSLNEMLDNLIRWGLEAGSAEWLVERIVFARGLRAGVTEYLKHELRKEISPDMIADMRTSVQEDVKSEIRREFDKHTMSIIECNIKSQLIDEMKSEIRDEVRSSLEDEHAAETIKDDIVDELRDSIRDAFDEDIMEQMKRDVKSGVKKEVAEVLKFKFRGSILTGMKYEIMEDMKEGLQYNLGGEEDDASDWKPEDPNTGKGRKRRR